VGAVGTLLGIGLGLALAQSLLGLVTRTINDLYFVLSVREVWLTPGAVIKAVGLGLGATLLAALAPARERRGAAREALLRSLLEARPAGRRRGPRSRTGPRRPGRAPAPPAGRRGVGLRRALRAAHGRRLATPLAAPPRRSLEWPRAMGCRWAEGMAARGIHASALAPHRHRRRS